MIIFKLRTENRETPYGVHTKQPVFSWNVRTKMENWKQRAYRVLVTCKGEMVWDSRKVISDQMVQIEYQGKPLVSDQRYTWKVWVEDEWGRTAWSETTWFETGLFEKEDWKGIYIGETKNHRFHLFRSTFVLKKKPLRARMFVSGLGHHQCYLNGEAVSDRVLEPGWTDYRKRSYYSVYNVTDFLQEGRNGIGAKLGDGMYNVPGGRYVYYPRSYGKIKLNIQLNVTYEDGERECFTTNQDWRMAKSPILFCCMYGGEDYDGRLEQPGFSRADFVEDASWEPARQVEPPMGERVGCPEPPMRVMKQYKPVSVRKTGDGNWLYDFGVNFSGWARIRISKNGAPAGSKLVLTPGELLDQNSIPDQRVTGKGYAWTYYLNEKEIQEFAPDFTYTGFRYVKVEGAVPDTAYGKQGMPLVEKITGEFIYPDVEQTGEFCCSNPLFNRIHGMVCQAVLSNLKSYMTDCPHRERLSQLGQTHLIAPGVMYNYDAQTIYEKLEQDMADSQRENGMVPNICPEYVVFEGREGFEDSPEWGSACIINPWYMYQRYGDKTAMKRHYGMMKRYLEYLTLRTHHNILHHGFGDWQDIGPNKPWSQNTPVPVVATCIYYYDIRIMEKVASILGKKEDEEEYRILGDQVYREYNLQFFDKRTGRYATGSQAAQALSLVTGLVPEEHRKKVTDQLRRDILNRNYAVTAGDVGHPFLIAAAIQENLSELINEMTDKRDSPGYGYQVENGATTLTEEWDGPEMGNPHGSQNHFVLGGIEEWFYGALGGIRLLRQKGTFGEVDICPYFPENMEKCRVKLNHPYGTIETSWRREEGEVVFSVVIPPNMTAHLYLEKEWRTVGSGRWQYRIANKGQEI